VWTKQQAVLLAFVPVLYAVVLGYWTWFRRPGVWTAALLPAMALIGTETLAAVLGDVPMKRLAPWHRLSFVIAGNLASYLDILWRSLGPTLVVFFLTATMYALSERTTRRQHIRQDAIYWVWLTAGLLVVLPGDWASDRYLFFVWPPIAALACAGLFRALSRVSTPRWAATAMAGIVFAHGAGQLLAAPGVLHGPSEVAKWLAGEADTSRVLYCGETDGQFVFAFRSAVGRPDTGQLVIRGDKLPPHTFAPDELEAFAKLYGVSHVVLERSPKPQPWDAVWDAGWGEMRLLREVPVSGFVNGSLRIYRVGGVSERPADTLVVQTEKVGARETTMHLDWSRRP
jgi:hypothetical protein